jgi:nucleoside-diphosphate-sugar epimerase
VAKTLLVLGGGRFVGRTAVLEGLARGWEVTAFNRGSGWVHPEARHLIGDRLEQNGLASLSDRAWDIVLDTWSGPPRAVRDSARELAARASHYVYVSSASVYVPPPPMNTDETAPTVEASPDATDGDYAECKRGAELAVLEAFGERALVARAGIILGPYEDVGRLTWWLRRSAKGGEILAPGPPDFPLQYVDARDLITFALDAALAGNHGPFNVTSRRGHATMRDLLDACVAATGVRNAELTWVEPDAIEAAGIEGWIELPMWLPPGEFDGMLGFAVERAHEAGLCCRPVHKTVSDTWEWLSASADGVPRRAELPRTGLDPTRERQVLAEWHARRA